MARPRILIDLIESEDEDIAEAASEAMAMAGAFFDDEDEDDEYLHWGQANCRGTSNSREENEADNFILEFGGQYNAGPKPGADMFWSRLGG